MSQELRTRRLRLTPFSLADTADLFAIRSDQEAMRYWDWPCDTTQAQTHAQAIAMLGDISAGKAIYATARLADGAFVGLFDLSELGPRDAELGFMTLRRLWGQGLATEAAGALVEEAWRRAIPRLKARIHAGNEASRRLLLKLGFLPHGPEGLVEVSPGRRVPCAHFRLVNPWP